MHGLKKLIRVQQDDQKESKKPKTDMETLKVIYSLLKTFCSGLFSKGFVLHIYVGRSGKNPLN